MASSDAALFSNSKTKFCAFVILIVLQTFEYIESWMYQPDTSATIDFPLFFKTTVLQFDILVLQQLILFSCKFALSTVFHRNSFFIVRSIVLKFVKNLKV
eukprot:TRINITY_DN1820_c0_g1_i1.p1 TRINITY_DN1820_c0_g1~~TRINITY_DN1820_c0_g1_i1.p1  ORF type:complete len:113 (-),score=11.16 TRINITY_DN1820_c0_g1_i1:186-485(-)